MGFIRKHHLKLIFAGLALVFAAGVFFLNDNMDDLLSASRERALGSVENVLYDFRPDFSSNFQWRMLGDSANMRYERARVSGVVSDDTGPDTTWNSGLSVGTQELMIELLTGPHKGDKVEISNMLLLLANVHLREGDEFIVRVHEDAKNGNYTAEVFAYNRAPVLFGFIGLFFLILIFIGGKKGLKSLIGLVFTLVCVWYVFLPLVFKGVAPFPAVIMIVGLTSFVTLALTGGWNRKSASAIAGTIAGVIVAGVVSLLTAMLAKMTVLNTANANALMFLAYDIPIKLSDILFAGVIIAALGAVMDVAMSVASAINEIHSVAGTADRKPLFKSGMNIGKDIIGTMSNTLILAFAGSSVNVLILLYAYNLPFNRLLSFDMLAVPVLQAIAGSIGVILTIPITAYIAAFLISFKKHTVKGGKRA